MVIAKARYHKGMASKIPATLRELRPHFIFRALEWLWDNSGKVFPMLAAVGAAVSWLRRYWQGLEWLDRLTIVVVVIFALGAIVLFVKFVVERLRKPTNPSHVVVNPELLPKDRNYVVPIPDTAIAESARKVFDALLFTQQVALKIIYDHPGINSRALLVELQEHLGITDTNRLDNIRRNVCDTMLVRREFGDTGDTVIPNPAVESIVIALFASCPRGGRGAWGRAAAEAHGQGW